MEYLPYTVKWLEAILRWGHVLFAILWVGNSFLFNYLDNKLAKLPYFYNGYIIACCNLL